MATYGAVAAWRPTATPELGRGSGMRLTRRGRLARFVVVVMLVALAGVAGVDRLAGEPARAGEVVGPALGTATVVVEPGDSLWSISRDRVPGADPREVVLRMRELNGLSSNLIQPGQVLLVPTRA